MSAAAALEPTPQPRERAVRCCYCRPNAQRTWNLSGLCDQHELLAKVPA